jgi:hypothetical protein
VIGTGGVIGPVHGYLEALAALAREHDILLIADEVITGFGRTGRMFGSQRYGITPGLITMAKGITFGMRRWAGCWSRLESPAGSSPDQPAGMHRSDLPHRRDHYQSPRHLPRLTHHRTPGPLRQRTTLMTDLDLTKYKALSFDCYGTLIDWETGIAAVLSPWAREQGLDLTDEELLLAYADNEASVEREAPSAL